MSSEQKKFYLTTPIYYVNARPHIGHAYTTIVADVLARRHRLLGDDTFFLTGTDEHGQKIERSASAAGIPPQQFADKVSAEFKALWDRMGLTYDDYIRTTEPRHATGVQKLFTTLYERGYIYLDSYTGSYCVSDEAFVDAPAGTPCPDCGRLLETVTEENFFFKLSEFQQPLVDLIESGRTCHHPQTLAAMRSSALPAETIKMRSSAQSGKQITPERRSRKQRAGPFEMDFLLSFLTVAGMSPALSRTSPSRAPASPGAFRCRSQRPLSRSRSTSSTCGSTRWRTT